MFKGLSHRGLSWAVPSAAPGLLLMEDSKWNWSHLSHYAKDVKPFITRDSSYALRRDFSAISQTSIYANNLLRCANHYAGLWETQVILVIFIGQVLFWTHIYAM